MFVCYCFKWLSITDPHVRYLGNVVGHTDVDLCLHIMWSVVKNLHCCKLCYDVHQNRLGHVIPHKGMDTPYSEFTVIVTACDSWSNVLYWGHGEIANQTPNTPFTVSLQLATCNTPTDIDTDIAFAITEHIRFIGIGQGKLEGNKTAGRKEEGLNTIIFTTCGLLWVASLWTASQLLVYTVFGKNCNLL